jgi:hypothetical protein
MPDSPLLWANGFDDQGAEWAGGEDFGGTDLRAWHNLDNGRRGGRRIGMQVGNSGDHDRGFRVPLDVEGELWIGAYMWWEREGANAEIYKHRHIAVFVDGSPAFDWRVNNDIQGSRDPYSVALGNGDLSVIPSSSSEITDWVENAVPDGNHHVKLRITRGETEGTVTVYIDGQEFTSWNLAGLAESEGPITGVHFQGRINATSALSDRFLMDDAWIATEDLGDAAVVLAVPIGSGNYTDGTPSEGGDRWELVNNVPPNDSEYITLDASERESFTLDTSEVAALPATNIVGVVAHVRHQGPSIVTPFLRIDGTDHDSDPITKASAALNQGTSVWGMNPDTGFSFSPADIGNLELGVREGS